MATVYVEFVHSPHVCVGFLLVFWIPPTFQRRAHEVNWHIYIVPVSVWTYVSGPAMEESPV